MSKKWIVIWPSIILFAVALVFARYWLSMFLGARNPREVCHDQMVSIDAALQQYIALRSNYPPSLATLPDRMTTAPTLVCPAVRGPIDELPKGVIEMEDLTDYMYVAGLNPSDIQTGPVVICPSINHKNKGGNVLFSNHEIKWQDRVTMDDLISDLYACAISNNCRIVVSKRLTERSGGKYKSYP